MVNWSPSLQTAVSDLVSYFGCVGTFFLSFFIYIFSYNLFYLFYVYILPDQRVFTFCG
jgi:hypothetical protein